VPEQQRPDRYRAALAERARAELVAGEGIVAMLPFATVPKRPKGPEGKVRVGVRQSWRRYRPTVLTDRRLLVFDSGRTPSPRDLLEAYPVEAVHLVEVIPPGTFGQVRLVLDLPGLGPVPFDTGRKERDDVEAFARVLGPPA